MYIEDFINSFDVGLPNIKSERKIAEELRPTFENVTRVFITETLYKILFSNEIPNFKFEFREDEAVKFIKKTLENYRNEFTNQDFIKELELRHKKIIQSIDKDADSNTETSAKVIDNIGTPVMVINNYKRFFELLRKIYEKDIDLFFRRTEYDSFPVYERDNLFEQIWLRCTPEDFNDPEKFLEKQAQMLCDNTFDKYDEETYFGKLDFLDSNILCVKNGIARTWDENSREFKITIYDKKHYDKKELFYRSNYILPAIRYGIYNRNGKKVCNIGSIQNINIPNGNQKEYIEKKVDRKKYKVNSGVPEEYIKNVEPKNILALSIFINILHKEGITDIEVPCMYVLDYEEHEKRIRKLIEDFNKWTEEGKKSRPLEYKRQADYIANIRGKEGLISEIKSERLIKTFERILYHYSNGTINSYPLEEDSYFRIHIPIVKSENEFKQEALYELFALVQAKYQENERE